MSRIMIVVASFAIIISAIALGGCGSKIEHSTIAGSVSGNNGSYAVSHVLIKAVPADGSATIYAVSGDDGNFSLDVKPGIQYGLGGLCYDPCGQGSFVMFQDRNGSNCQDVTLAPDETVALIMSVYRTHPPMSFNMVRDPVTGNTSFASSTPVRISGHVYLDGKAVSGALVEAVPPYKANGTANVTDDSGAYTLGLDSRVQYSVTATYQGLRHTIWPVFVYDNETGIYDIPLTRTPKSTLTGTGPDDGPRLEHPGVVTIEATPVDGGMPVTAVAGSDGSYSLEVEPFVYYDVAGKYRSPGGAYHNVTLAYNNTGIQCPGFMLRSNETALVNYFIPEAFDDNETSPTP